VWIKESIKAALRKAVARLRKILTPPKPLSKDETTLVRLSGCPALEATRFELGGRAWMAVDGPSFVGIYREQFVDEIFRFELADETPRFLDCGANVGIVTVYLKSLYPSARITCFEPDPACFEALEFNCRDLREVELVRAAVWKTDGQTTFAPVGAVGGHLEELAASPAPESIDIKAIRLRDYLSEPVHFLKMDIEGSEMEVLKDCADRLCNVQRMFIEYHSFEKRPQRLAECAGLIEEAGFRMHVHSSMEEKQPFLGVKSYNNKDLRLNLFCYRS